MSGKTITPHIQEATRLVMEEVDAARIEMARELSRSPEFWALVAALEEVVNEDE